MRNGALGYYRRMCSLEMGVLAVFWQDVLDNLNKTSKSLQRKKMQLNSAVASIKSLKAHILSKRDKYGDYVKLGAELTNNEEYKNKRPERRSVLVNPLDYGKEPETVFKLPDSFRINHFLPIIDTFVVALDERIAAYEEIDHRFGFLSQFNTLTKDKLSQHAKILIDIYSDDLDNTLEGELSQFQEYCLVALKYDPEKSEVSREQAMYSLILDKQTNVRESFPNVEIVLRIYLTIMITNCTGERAFSKLKLIKNESRTTMLQLRLNCLTIMASERDIIREIPIDENIQRFAEEKARKVLI